MVDVVGDRRRTRSRRPTTRSSAARSPTRLFLGNLSISSSGLTLTRANGTELGSFVDEGFERRNLIRVTIKIGALVKTTTSRSPTPAPRSPTTRSRSLDALAVEARGYAGTAPTRPTPSRSSRTRATGRARCRSSTRPVPRLRSRAAGRSSGPIPAESDLPGWLGDGFLEGQWVEICVSNGAGACIGTTAASRSASSAATTTTKDNKLEFRSYVDLDGVYHLVDDLGIFGATGTLLPNMLIRRIAAGRDVQRRQLVRVAARRSARRRRLRDPDQPRRRQGLPGRRPTVSGSSAARWRSRAASPAPTARSTSASSCRARPTARCSRSARSRPSRSRSTSSTSSTTARRQTAPAR